jgi:hypothetical protein
LVAKCWQLYSIQSPAAILKSDFLDALDKLKHVLPTAIP